LTEARPLNFCTGFCNGQIQSLFLFARGIHPVHFDHQIQPGTFEFTLSHIIDNELDLSIFDRRCKNDETRLTADSGFHNENNMEMLAEKEIRGK